MNVSIEKGIEVEKKYPFLTNKNLWQIYRGKNYIGCTSYLFKKYGKPKSGEEFFAKYIEDTQSNNLSNRGRGLEELYKVIREFHKKAVQYDNTITEEDCYHFFVKKIAFDTVAGLYKEEELKQRFREKGFYTKESTSDQDINEGIDFLVYTDNECTNLKALIQVKPYSFFCGNYKEDLLQDRRNLYAKSYSSAQKYKVPFAVCVYNNHTNKWMKDTKGNTCIRVSNLINKEGYRQRYDLLN